MKKSLFTVFFIISVIGVFSGIMFQVKWLDYVFKPMIMVSIAGNFFLNSKNINKKIVRLALLAFLFSLFGDSFLMFTESGMIFFIFGLASFLVAQIFFIILFLQTVKVAGGDFYLRKNSFYLIGFFAYGSVIYSTLFNQLDNVLKIAVLSYIAAIMGMSIMALNRYKAVSTISFVLVFLGSILFVISDSLIALDKFLKPIPYDRFFIMTTYIAAQYLIMRGILKQFEKTSL